jgi:NAD(P)-dependent dehydrogenase (short-subunit alcohol dehydrogenase family)
VLETIAETDRARRAVVTGAASGIGEAVAGALLAVPLARTSTPDECASPAAW